MKKFGIGLGSVILLFIISFVLIQKTSIGVGPFYDNFIGKAPVVDYYVNTKNIKYEQLWSGKNRYTVTGYDANGKQQRIVFVPRKIVKPDNYIWISAKGSSGKGWSYVQEEKIPLKALELVK